MNKFHNPYATALDGLILDDPVSAFFDFCRERENIRLEREMGAVAYLDRLQTYFGLDNHQKTCDRMIALQKELWPEAKRAFQPIDIEYLSCECRKYYSYVNGTKLFEGKNRFHPKRYMNK